MIRYRVLLKPVRIHVTGFPDIGAIIDLNLKVKGSMLHMSWHQNHVSWLLLGVKNVRILLLLLSSAFLLNW